MTAKVEHSMSPKAPYIQLDNELRNTLSEYSKSTLTLDEATLNLEHFLYRIAELTSTNSGHIYFVLKHLLATWVETTVREDIRPGDYTDNLISFLMTNGIQIRFKPVTIVNHEEIERQRIADASYGAAKEQAEILSKNASYGFNVGNTEANSEQNDADEQNPAQTHAECDTDADFRIFTRTPAVPYMDMSIPLPEVTVQSTLISEPRRHIPTPKRTDLVFKMREKILSKAFEIQERLKSEENAQENEPIGLDIPLDARPNKESTSKCTKGAEVIYTDCIYALVDEVSNLENGLDSDKLPGLLHSITTLVRLKQKRVQQST